MYVVAIDGGGSPKFFPHPQTFDTETAARKEAIKLSERYGQSFYVFYRVGGTEPISRPTWTYESY